MSQVKMFQFEVNTELEGETLKQGAHRFLTEIRKISISKREVKELIDHGKLHLNKSKVRKAGIVLTVGDKVLIELPRKFLKAQDDDIKIELNLDSSHILFEDNYIIAVNKPSGISTQASLDPKRDHLYAAVRRYLQKNEKSEVYVGLHHRLDVDTSGVVVFTKKKSANKGLGNQFEFRKIQKTYLAICSKAEERVRRTWKVENHLGRTRSGVDSKMLRMESVKSGGDKAVTDFALLSSAELSVSFSAKAKELLDSQDYMLVEARPKTGRTHQIRVHLFEDGMGIVGDRFYITEGDPLSSRLMLHAWKLKLRHPITEEPLEIEAPASF